METMKLQTQILRTLRRVDKKQTTVSEAFEELCAILSEEFDKQADEVREETQETYEELLKQAKESAEFLRDNFTNGGDWPLPWESHCGQHL